MKQKSPATILWELAKKEHSKLKTSVFIGVSVLLQGLFHILQQVVFS